MRHQINTGYLDLLREDEIERIHEASLSLLSNPGMQSTSMRILRTFQQAAIEVDFENRTVHLTPEIVERALRTAPKSFIFHGRDPKWDLLLETGQVYFGMGGASEPFILDYSSKQPRTPTYEDMVNCTRIGQELENVDFILALCSAGDRPKEQMFLYEYDALIRNTSKPIVYTAPGSFYSLKLMEMACAASGGEDGFRSRPWVGAFVTPISPLQASVLDECIYELAAFGAPAVIRPSPMMGATSPVTLAANLAQANAEALFMIVLSQIIHPGTPVIYGPGTPAMDMATTQCTYGSPDEALGRACIGQLGRFYHLPSWNTAATESKLPDAAAAAETLYGMQLNAMAGITMIQAMGTMASGFYGSAEMLVICNEIARMLRYLLRGIEISDESLALEVIREVGPGGNFLSQTHTVQNFKSAQYFPSLFRRQTITQWQARGAHAILDEAHLRVENILAQGGPVELPSGADQELKRVLEQAILDVSAG